MSDVPDFIWPLAGWLEAMVDPDPKHRVVEYVRRDPAVLAELPEVQALVAAAQRQAYRQSADVAKRFHDKSIARSDANPDDEAEQGFGCASGSIEHAIRALTPEVPQ
jgi:hypothetical protein